MRDIPELFNRRDHFGPGSGLRIGGDGEIEGEYRAGEGECAHVKVSAAQVKVSAAQVLTARQATARVLRPMNVELV
jgi:hypothetical protein